MDFWTFFHVFSKFRVLKCGCCLIALDAWYLGWSMLLPFTGYLVASLTYS